MVQARYGDVDYIGLGAEMPILTSGIEHTLKWGNGNTTTCAGDSGFTPPGAPPSEHGFVDIGEGNSNNNVRTAITYGSYPNSSSTPSSLYLGETLDSVPGNRGSAQYSKSCGCQ